MSTKPYTRRILGGVAAVGMGAALFAASGHTFAKWFDSLPAGEVQTTSGELHMEPNGAPTLSVTSAAGVTAPVAQPTNYLIVPGDSAEYSIPLNLTVTGDNNQATLKLDAATLVAGTMASGVDGSAATGELLAALKDQVVVTVDPAAGGTALTAVVGQTNTFTVPTGLKNASYTVKVSLKFTQGAGGAATADPAPTDGTAGANWWKLDAQHQSVDLTKAKLTLTQNIPTV